jgi:hypothetical protein
MNRRSILGLALAAIIAASASVLAANVHLIGPISVSTSGTSLTISASIAGLGNVPNATFNLVGTVTVDSRCYTRKGNTPQAANKQETIDVNSTETFPVKNGRTNVSFTISPLSTLDCPGGQHVVIENFSYNLTLTGPDGFSETVP